jgi:uncharacterized protein (TIGR02145 family)
MIAKQKKPMQKRNVLVRTGAIFAMLFFASCTNQPQKSIDIDGNSYSSVKIGTMQWAGENLNVSHYRNGDSIPEIQDPDVWSTLTTGAWCYNENKTENGKTYGKLYNWYAVNDPRGLSPKGWHVATDAEWSELSSLLGGSAEAGGAMKAKVHWKEPNDGATNKSGFAALPAGARRDIDGKFMAPGEYSRFWSSTESTIKSAMVSALGYFDGALRQGKAGKNNGFSVRCVTDKN